MKMDKVVALKKSDGQVYVEIYHDAENGLVMDVWKANFGTQQNFRNAILKAIEVIKERNCTRWVGDLREMKGSFDSSSTWLFQTAVPQAMQHGLRRSALIWPANVFSKLSVKDTMHRINNLELRAFDQREQAFEWVLKELEPVS